MRPAWCGLAVALAALAAGGACRGSAGERDTAKDRPAVKVETRPLQRMRVERRVDVAGTLTSPDTVRVSTQVAGIVGQVAIELGTEVRQGDLLVRLDPRELTLTVTRAESALRQVEAQLGLTAGSHEPADEDVASVRQARAARDDARNAYMRAQQLTARQLLAKVELDSAETRLKIAEASYQAAIDNARSLKAALEDRRAALDLARKRLDDSLVRAPVSGAVAERTVQAGEFVRENTTVATIVRMDALVLETAIQERHAGVIRPGQQVEFVVEAFPKRLFHGTVTYLGPAIDPATRTFPIEVAVPNREHELRPGFFAKGAVLTHTDPQVLAAPEAAVSTLAGVSAVFVIADGKARQQEVTVGTRQDGLIEIVDGLAGSERLATSQLNQLATGSRVEETPAKAAGRATP